MKSSIKIALGENNNPVIQMRIHSTDDIRDILFKQFQESFRYSSNLCYAFIDSCYASSDSEGLRATITISPLPSNSDYICYQRVEEIYNALTNNGSLFDISMVTGGGTIGFYTNHGNGPGKELSREELRKLDIINLVKTITETINGLSPKG